MGDDRTGADGDRPSDDRRSAGFSVAETARRVGVAASTLRTWERRYGLRPTLRTAGGHRRYTIEDIAHLQRLHRLVEEGMPTASAAAGLGERSEDRDGRSRHASLGDRLEAAVDALDADESYRIAERLVARLGVVDAWVDVFVPRLQAWGERWAETGHGTEREHLATAAIQFALSRHLALRSRANVPIRVLGVAPSAEGHVLPLDALAAAAADLDIGVRTLGTLPREGIHDAVTTVRPSVVVVWSRSRDTVDSALLRGLRRQVPVVCAAGPGWTARRLPAGVAHVADLPGALASIRAWLA